MKSTRIKLTEELYKRFEDIETLKGQVEIILLKVGLMNKESWNELKKLYPDKNFAGAKIEHETKELILPFENDEN